MDKPEEPAQEIQPAKPAEKNRGKISGKTIKTALLIVILVLAAAGGSYWWRNKTANEAEKKQAATITSLQQTTASLEKQLAEEKDKNAKPAGVPAPAPCTAKAPTAAVIENIEASITSGNTAALEGYMAASVNVIIAASEGLGAKTPTQAVASITDFISSDTASWDYDFSLPAPTLSSYAKGSYAQYFPSIAVVGKATNKKVISFSFDCNAKISTVFLASNEDLLK